MILLPPFFLHRYYMPCPASSKWISQCSKTFGLDSDPNDSKFYDCLDAHLYNCERSEILLYLQAKKVTCCIFMDAGRRRKTTKSKTKNNLLLTAISLVRIMCLLDTQACISTWWYEEGHMISYSPGENARALGTQSSIMGRSMFICYSGRKHSLYLPRL